MLFNSFTFIIFFTFVFFTSRTIAPWEFRKFFLLIVSYVFYAAWNPPFVVLLWISTFADWHLARWIGNEENKRKKGLYLFCSLAINLGLLAYFKYGHFFLENLNGFLKLAGIPHEFGKMSIILPAGISFYTFQTLSYTIDVYRQKIKLWPSFLDYTLYITFFPHLVAGPIMRADYFLPQCIEPKKASHNQIGWGAILFILGLFSKMVIADALLSGIVGTVYDSEKTLNFFEAWAGTFAFAIQIFCDFFGYSTCAIGVALMLGFVFVENFHSPYGAVGFSDFWRRWHISFSTWLRDYLYVPLGGNRHGSLRTCINLMITMLLGGLWHGASWMFVIWGGLHGLYLIIEKSIKKFEFSKESFWMSTPAQMMLASFTFILVCFTWVFFRSQTLERAFSILHSMIGFSKPAIFWQILSPIRCFCIFLITGFVLAIHFCLRNSSFLSFFRKMRWYQQGALMALMIFGIILSIASENHAFIYFQF